MIQAGFVIVSLSEYIFNYNTIFISLIIKIQQTVSIIIQFQPLSFHFIAMKKSILVQSLSAKKIATKKIIPNQVQKNITISTFETSASTQSQLEDIFKIMQCIINHENSIQTYKEMLTERGDFNPQALFEYVSSNQNMIDKKHIVSLFQQNLMQTSEDEIKLYLNSYGYKDKINYSAFLNLIYPVDVDLLKYVAVTGMKKYSNQSKVTQEVLFIFLLLVKEQINLLENMQTYKNQLIPKINRKQIKQIMRVIKKNGQCKSQMEIQSQNFVKYEQLKSLFKKLTNNYLSKNPPTSARGTAKKNQQNKIQNQCIYSILQKNLPCIFRKLSMGKNTFINFEQFQFWLRPWNKSKINNINNQEPYPNISNVIEISGINELQNWSELNSQQNLNFPLTLVHNI